MKKLFMISLILACFLCSCSTSRTNFYFSTETTGEELIFPFSNILAIEGPKHKIFMKDEKALVFAEDEYKKFKVDYLKWLGEGNYYESTDGDIIPFSSVALGLMTSEKELVLFMDSPELKCRLTWLEAQEFKAKYFKWLEKETR